MKSILKKKSSITGGTASAKPAKTIRRTEAQAVDEDEGGVAMFKAHQQEQQGNEDDELKGLASESEDEIEGGATLSKDHTAELLKGFESSSDGEEDELSKAGADAQPTEGDDGIPTEDLPALPNSAKNEVTKSTKQKKQDDDDPPITLYIGRIPHGFYEHQMRAYFSQFGDIAHLRLAHNRRTGASKHFGFIQFSSGEVGKIVQRTMHGYIMFGHILQVKEVAPSKLEDFKSKGIDIWKGEGKRFKKIPWRDLQRGALKSASREEWEKRVEKEKKRRADKAEKLRKLGYEFSAPEMVSVGNVKTAQAAEA